MAVPNSRTPQHEGVEYVALNVIADDSDSVLNSVPPLTKSVKVAGVTNGATDYIVLPPLNSCPDGHKITILCSASSNFEVRTPSASAEEINSENCDGTKELLATNTTILFITKINNTIGWMSEVRTAIGAYGSAVVPD